MQRLKQILLFFMFPESGFRQEVQAKQISRSKIIYAVCINLVFPLIFLILGLAIQLHPPLKKQIQSWQDTEISEKVDDYGRYAPIPFLIALEWVGMKAQTPIILRVATFGTAYVIGDFVVHRTKKATQVTRPKAEYGNTSFPSQHTNQAFLAAMALHHEYIGAKGGGLVSAAGMACAGTVGYLRYARDKHWSSDVLVGAAVGMIVVNFAYMFLYKLLALLLSKAYSGFKKAIKK